MRIYNYLENKLLKRREAPAKLESGASRLLSSLFSKFINSAV